MIHKLYDEGTLVTALQTETIFLIQNCPEIPPIKKLVECHDILKLTFEIYTKYPADPPACDEGALIYLKNLTRELSVYHWAILPKPEFPSYRDKILRLLTVFQVPRHG